MLWKISGKYGYRPVTARDGDTCGHDDAWYKAVSSPQTTPQSWMKQLQRTAVTAPPNKGTLDEWSPGIPGVHTMSLSRMSNVNEYTLVCHTMENELSGCLLLVLNLSSCHASKNVAKLGPANLAVAV